jgi:hypothetical protein
MYWFVKTEFIITRDKNELIALSASPVSFKQSLSMKFESSIYMFLNESALIAPPPFIAILLVNLVWYILIFESP